MRGRVGGRGPCFVGSGIFVSNGGGAAGAAGCEDHKDNIVSHLTSGKSGRRPVTNELMIAQQAMAKAGGRQRSGRRMQLPTIDGSSKGKQQLAMREK